MALTVKSGRKELRFCKADAKPFSSSDPAQEYCSPECRISSKNKRNNPKNNAKRVFSRKTVATFHSVDSEGSNLYCLEEKCTCDRFLYPLDGCADCAHKGDFCRKHENVNPECRHCGHRLGDHKHDLVLVGVSQNQIDNAGRREGLGTEEIFEFLYSQFELDPKAAYVGFYLGYDFTQWLKGLPFDVCQSLTTDVGMWKRKNRGKNSQGNRPVIWNGWHMDMLPNRRLSIWPVVCDCELDKAICNRKHSKEDMLKCKYTAHCTHKQKPVMHICDAGPFWQCALLDVLDPKKWDEGAPCTPEEYELLKKGKSKRAIAGLDEEMKMYNRLENEKFEYAMRAMDQGLIDIGIILKPKLWYGPGAVAEAWFKTIDMPDHDDLFNALDNAGLNRNAANRFYDAARKSYIAGWFEIPAHGFIPYPVIGYDVNSAYPNAMAHELPCLLHGRYSVGKYTDGIIPPSEDYTLVYGKVSGSDKYLGSMLHRTDHASICRPKETIGWFWLKEIRASEYAGLIDKTELTEWCCYEPCSCPGPLAKVAHEFLRRLEVGKNTVLGKAIKLTLNSLYGKFAQTVGAALYENWIYASLITSGCRQKILGAIGSHPEKSKAVVMIATDGVFFTSPHPVIDADRAEGIAEWNAAHPDKPTSQDLRLGHWEKKNYGTMTLFKPGVYWDENASKQIQKWINGETEDRGGKFIKSRGINARTFAEYVIGIQDQFQEIIVFSLMNPGKGNPRIPTEIDTRFMRPTKIAGEPYEPRWPRIIYYPGFNLTTIGVAIAQNHYDQAGQTNPGKGTYQSSDPVAYGKRAYPAYIEDEMLRTHVPVLEPGTLICKAYEKKNGEDDPFEEFGRDKLGSVDPLGVFEGGSIIS